MYKINFILFTLLLISSCGLLNKMKESKKIMQKIQEHDDTHKTLKEELIESLSESQNKGLDFLKEVLKGDNGKLNSILSVGKNKLDRLKIALDNIQNAVKNCNDSRQVVMHSQYGHDGHDPIEQKEGFKTLVVEYVEGQLGLRGDNSQNDIPPNVELNPLEGMCFK